MATYITSYGNTYEFSFEQQADGGWRAYIVRQPSYGSRNTGSDKIHRLQDSRGYYICWNRPLYSLTDMKNVAAEWARRTDRYIRTGTPIEA